MDLEFVWELFYDLNVRKALMLTFYDTFCNCRNWVFFFVIERYKN